LPRDFSAHMDEHHGDMTGFARKKGWESILPEYQQGRAVLVVRTGAAMAAPRPAAPKKGPAPQKKGPALQKKKVAPQKKGPKPQAKGGPVPQGKGSPPTKKAPAPAGRKP